MRTACVTCSCALVALCAGMADAQAHLPVLSQTSATTEGRPALRPERVAAEVFVGTYAGLAGYFVGRGVGTIATTMLADSHDVARERIAHAAGIVGGSFAMGGTIYGIGNIGAETGNFRTTMVGVAIGAASSLALSHYAFHNWLPGDRTSTTRRWLTATIESVLPAIGGTIAFNSSRKWQR